MVVAAASANPRLWLNGAHALNSNRLEHAESEKADAHSQQNMFRRIELRYILAKYK